MLRPSLEEFKRKAKQGNLIPVYREILAVHDKAAFELQFTKELCDPNFHTGTHAADQRLLRNLIA